MNSIFNKINIYWRLARFDRPIGTYLLLWPTLMALFFTISYDSKRSFPEFKYIVIFTLGVIIMRAAGCVINDYADRNFDKFVERTKTRPLTNGELSETSALVFFFILLALAGVLVLFTNRLTILLAFVGLGLTAIYPFLKRFTNLPQIGLGMAFSWGIPMAFSAVLGYVPNIAWLMLLANAIWVLAYDTIYALDDLPYDTKIGVKSTAILFGKHVKKIILILDILAWSLFLFIGLYLGLGIIFAVFMLFAAIVFVYDNIRLINAKAFLPIFLNNNYVGIFMFLGVFLDYLYR